ncbi:MAG: hypothetical protein M3Y72_05400 [Acidobacteriota bacterium]|nr:hypothetical protein [Acidobacteriota bacterium]
MDKKQERRTDTRLLCADLVELIWAEASGKENRRIGNLEDISLCGVCLQLELPIHVGTRVRMLYGGGELAGIVRYALYRDEAHFIGVEFDGDTKWSAKHFIPRHLLDPRELMDRAMSRRANSPGPALVQ